MARDRKKAVSAVTTESWSSRESHVVVHSRKTSGYSQMDVVVKLDEPYKPMSPVRIEFTTNCLNAKDKLETREDDFTVFAVDLVPLITGLNVALKQAIASGMIPASLADGV